MENVRQSEPIYLNLNAISKDKINEKIVYSEYAVYNILNYEKLGLSYNDVSTSLYRSVITSCPEKKILCYSPPKTKDVSMFMKSTPLLFNDPCLLINEIVEGVMINLFYDSRISRWEISTKSGVSGLYSYNKDKILTKNLTSKDNFLHLFLDALRVETLNDIELVKHLPKDMCYSFVLQHPKNKICLDIKEPAVFLVAVYLIKNPINEPSYVKLISPESYKNWHIFQNMFNVIRFPNQVDQLKNLNDIICEEMSIQRAVNNRGVMITNLKTGEMYEVPNIEYLKLFKRRNPHNDLLYKYLCILRLNKVNEYLTFYPHDKKAFRRYSVQFEELVVNVYNSYIIKYVVKKHTYIKNIYYKHIYKLHYDIYLPSLRRDKEKRKITMNEVRNYFMKYEPHILMKFLLSVI